MPRTKMPRKNSSMKKQIQRNVLSHVAAPIDLERPTKRSEDLNALLAGNYESPEHFQKEFEQYYEKIIEAHRKRYEAACEHVKTTFKETLHTLPESYLSSAVHMSYDEDLLKGENKGLNSAAPKVRPSRPRKLDSASEFKRPKTPMVKRSSSKKRSVSAPPPMALPSADRFKTPNSSLRALGPMSVITPKVSSTPMCFLRRPEHGEVAFSTSGSPLLVGRISIEDIPTVTVPLMDGRIFSILPDPGACPPSFPEFDEETKRYLRTLQQHLAILAPGNP